jgi:hypothetical protein
MFAKEKDSRPAPTLLCNDVGLRKTIEIVGTISMLVHIIELQRKGRNFPPLLEGEDYFKPMDIRTHTCVEEGRGYFAGKTQDTDSKTSQKTSSTKPKSARQTLAENKAAVVEQQDTRIQSGSLKPQSPKIRKWPSISSSDDDELGLGAMTFKKVKG